MRKNAKKKREEYERQIKDRERRRAGSDTHYYSITPEFLPRSKSSASRKMNEKESLKNETKGKRSVRSRSRLRSWPEEPVTRTRRSTNTSGPPKKRPRSTIRIAHVR